jgi:tetratricopeptide (TPR) repeat protein
LTQIVEIEESYQKAAELLKEATRQRDMQEAYQQGKSFYERKEWAQAVAAFGKVESIAQKGEYSDVANLLSESRHQKQLDAWIREAEDYINQENWEAAIKILDANDVASERSAGEVALRYARARCYMERWEWDKAAENLQSVIAKRPNYQSDLESMYQEAARKARLVKLFQEAVGLINQGDWRMAKTRLDQILVAEPDNADARQRLSYVEEEIHLANLYEQAEKRMALRQWAESVSFWENILNRRPDGYQDAQAKLDEAQKQLELATFYKQGVDAAGQGEWRKARDTFARVADRDSNYRDVQTQLKNAQDKITLTHAFEQGITALKKGKAYNLDELKRAVDHLQQACNIDPRFRGVDNRLREAKREYTLLGYYLEGQKAFDQGKWEEAIAHWKKLVEDEGQPDYHGDAARKLAEAERQAHLHALYHRAQEVQQLQAWDQAAILLESLLTEEPSFPNAGAMLAEMKTQQRLLAAFNEAQQFMAGERWTEAIERLTLIQQERSTYRQAEVTDLLKQAEHNRYLEVTYNQGMAAIQSEDWDAARRHFEKVFNTDPDYPDVETRLLQARQQQTLRDHYQAGDVAAKAENWDTAIECFIKIQEIDPAYRDARDRLGEVQRQQQLATDYQEALEYLNAKQWTEAIPILERILAQDKTYKKAAQKLAEAQKQIILTKKYAQAQAAMEKEVWAEVVGLLTEIISSEPDYKDAAALLETAQKEQTLDDLYKRTAVLREKKESWEEALDLLEQVIAIDPDYKEAVPWKFDLEDKITQKREEERLARLEATYNQVVGLLDTDAESAWDEGIRRLEQLLQEEPEHEKAQQLLKQARQKRANRVAELRHQAEEAGKKGRWSQAIAALQRLKRLESGDPSLSQELQRAEQAHRQQRRNRILLGGLAAMLGVICLLAGIWGGSALLFPPSTPNATAIAQVTLTAKPELTHTAGPTPSEDGSAVAPSPTSIPTETLPQATSVSTETTKEPVPITPPTAPNNVEVVNATENSITFNWKNSADNQTKVVVKRNGDVVTELPADSQAYTDNGLACESSFEYTLTAVNEAGESEPAQITAQTTKCSPPPPSLSGKIAIPVFDTNAGTYNVYIARAEEGWQPKLFFQDGSQPAFSPDGRQIVLRSWRKAEEGFGQRLVLFPSLRVDAGDERLMTYNLEDAHPSLGRNGDIVFHTRREGAPILVTLGTWSGAESDIANQHKLGPGENPDWLGSRIIYYASAPSPGLYVMNADGGNIKPVLGEQGPLAPAAAPDGDHVAVSLQRGGRWHIFTLSVSQGETSLVQLTNENADDQLPVWSPDGQFIAFVSNRGGKWAVWVMPAPGAQVNADGTDQRKLFDLSGPIDGKVSIAPNMSYGWGEERLSWAP